MNEAFLKRLFSKVDCGVCGQRYDTSNIKVLGNEDDLWFLSISCSSCGTQGLIAAVVREGSIEEVTTDLTEADLQRFAGSEAVSADDVIDMHRFLKEFSGDFTGLFSEE